jgi:uncharacterized protein YbcI
MPEPGEVSAEAVREEIATEILRVHEEAYGVGANAIKVHLLDDIVLVVIDCVLATSERTLLEAGKGDAVQATREAFQDAIAPTFTAIVERATGRRVDAFVSRMNMELLFSIELFRLRPSGV